MLIAGLDEAGRGAVLGPLVIAGVSIRSEDEEKLKELGVRDSKELSPKRREFLAKKIEKIAKDIIILKVGPCKIDNYKKQGINLNQLEGMKFATIINYLTPEKAYIDGPENNLNRFKLFVEKMLKNPADLVVEHRADQTYPVVSAASIMAKVTRDSEVEKLRKKYGIEGSGYPSDERTINWMKNWLKEHKDFPEGVARKSWATTELMMGKKKQSKLGSFFGKIKS